MRDPAAIEAAIRDLEPLRLSNGLPPLTDFDIRSPVHVLLTVGGSAGPRAKPPPKNALAGLRAVSVQVSKLLSAIGDLDPIALDALGNQQATILQLNIMKIIADSQFGEEPSLKAISTRRNPAQNLAVDAAYVFLTITGQRPSRINSPDGGPVYGPYIDFLGKIFAARNISSSVENAAREALKVMELQRTI